MFAFPRYAFGPSMQDKDKKILPPLADMKSVYLHVPFCARLCGYCRFYKLRPTNEAVDLYLEALEAEARFRRERGDLQGPFDTVYWGGGTPAALSEAKLARAAEILGLQPLREWTVEVAPSSINKSKLALLKSLGVNRISLGIQSFSKKTLSALGRPHPAEAAARAVDDILSVGFEKFSVDLIFGVGGQTLEDFRSDILAAAGTGASHISAYCLEFENGTSNCPGRGKTPDEASREADFMTLAMRLLPELGFRQYEISNYAKDGCECLHNRITWAMGSWLGFGPAAASQWGASRFKNPSDINAWADMQAGHTERKFEDVVPLDDDELFSSALIFGLRTSGGVDLMRLKMRYPRADSERYAPSIALLERENFLEVSTLRNPCGYEISKILRLTEKGRLNADAVAVELL